MPYKFFRMCVIEMQEESKANNAASNGKKYTRNPEHNVLHQSDKQRYDNIIKERKEQIKRAREGNNDTQLHNNTER